MNTCSMVKVGACAAVLASVPSAIACETENFDGFAAGAPVTTQVTGITFTALDSLGNPIPGHSPTVLSPLQGTSSPPHALHVPPVLEFNPEQLRMDFANLQRGIRMRLGNWTGADVSIRVYDDTLTLVSTIPLTGLAPGAFNSVLVGSETGPKTIRRIEIQSAFEDFEYIDDLEWEFDPTPPIADIQMPATITCVCDIVSIVGVSCDDDGQFDHDMLEYRAAGDPGWTLVGSFASPLCAPGTLYTWDTSSLPSGLYELRLTSFNSCGLQDSDYVTVRVDHEYALTGADITRPLDGWVIGGNFCVSGTAYDICADTYAVDYRPSGAPGWAPIGGGSGVVFNDVLAQWDTTGVPDGAYEVRVTGTTVCGDTASVIRSVTVDNTYPTALITSADNCSVLGTGLIDVIGTADDANFASYSLAITGGPHNGWQTIATGASPVNNGVLGTIDTTNLPPCCYTIRLRVADKTNVGCIGGRFSDYYVSVTLGTCEGDANLDGAVDVSDISFVIFRLGTCP